MVAKSVYEGLIDTLKIAVFFLSHCLISFISESIFDILYRGEFVIASLFLFMSVSSCKLMFVSVLFGFCHQVAPLS